MGRAVNAVEETGRCGAMVRDAHKRKREPTNMHHRNLVHVGDVKTHSQRKRTEEGERRRKKRENGEAVGTSPWA